jgi:hypothetical protein
MNPLSDFYSGLYGVPLSNDERRVEYVLTKHAKPNEEHILYIEMCCTGMFGNPSPGRASIIYNITIQVLQLISESDIPSTFC